MTDHFTKANIPIKPVYTPEDVEGFDVDEKLGLPGEFPYTRGIRPAGAWTWIQRELSGEGDPKKSNEQLKYLISKGQKGIDVISDAPSTSMLDADHPMAAAAVGTQGVSISCLDDFRELWKDLPLGDLTISSSIAANFTLAALYIIANEQGVPLENLRGSIVQAPFYSPDCGYGNAANSSIFSRLRLSCDSIQFCAEHMPRFHSFIEDTYFFSEAALDVVEEMALGFIEIRYIVNLLLKRGLDIDSFAPRIAILLTCGMDFFEEIAKIRATRRLFARMMKDEYNAKDPRSLAPVITSHTSGLSMTAQQPFNNIVRGATQTLALVLAGVQAIEISAFDEAFRTPSPESHLVGIRTQQVIGLETNVTKVVDPLGGSYYVESLTDDVEKRIWDMVLEIEARGDPAELQENGYFRTIFTNAMERYQKQVREGELKKVGLNCFEMPDEEDTLLREVVETKIEPYSDRIDWMKNYKKNRNMDKVKAALRMCAESVKDESVNLILPTITAFEAGATSMEITGVMRVAEGGPYDAYGMVESII